jgi:hypothetical protein
MVFTSPLLARLFWVSVQHWVTAAEFTTHVVGCTVQTARAGHSAVLWELHDSLPSHQGLWLHKQCLPYELAAARY